MVGACEVFTAVAIAPILLRSILVALLRSRVAVDAHVAHFEKPLVLAS